MEVKLLDCTLREAPVDNMLLGENIIADVTQNLFASGIDIVEIGFLKSIDKYIYGTTYFKEVSNITSILNKFNVTKKYDNQKIVTLVDYGRVEISSLIEKNKSPVDGIRVCFKKGEFYKSQELFHAIKLKGYDLFIQHVDTKSYTDDEIIEILGIVNHIKPKGYSIVDTFGSMYHKDVIHYVHLCSRYLNKEIQLGFHGHNNLQLANSNAQIFIDECRKYSFNSVCVDTSLFGCGRGAGNANTELIAQYINRNIKFKYDLAKVLDLIDVQIPHLKKKCEWGYNVPYAIAGMNSVHVFNIQHLLSRHTIKYSDLYKIINLFDESKKKCYDYSYLSSLYIKYFENKVDDKESISYLSRLCINREVLFILPGFSLNTFVNELNSYIEAVNPIVVQVNFIDSRFATDLYCFSSIYRYMQSNIESIDPNKLILTSNISKKININTPLIFNYASYIKEGWVNLDVSLLLFLRIFSNAGVSKFSVAFADGFQHSKNYFTDSKEIQYSTDETNLLNKEISEMIKDFLHTTESSINFITPSPYRGINDDNPF